MQIDKAIIETIVETRREVEIFLEGLVSRGVDPRVVFSCVLPTAIDLGVKYMGPITTAGAIGFALSELPAYAKLRAALAEAATTEEDTKPGSVTFGTAA